MSSDDPKEFRPRLLEIRERVDQLQSDLLRINFEFDRTDLEKVKESLLSDLGFLYKKLQGTLDELRKECWVREERISKTICSRVMREFQQDSSRDFKAIGQFSSATPKVKAQPNLPSFGSPEYIKILGALGVPEEAAAKGVLQIHFPKMTAYLTDLEERGINHNFPKSPKLSAVYRKRKAQ